MCGEGCFAVVHWQSLRVQLCERVGEGVYSGGANRTPRGAFLLPSFSRVLMKHRSTVMPPQPAREGMHCQYERPGTVPVPPYVES